MMRILAALLVAGTGLAQEEFQVAGRVEPTAEVTVKARVDGYVSRVAVKPGQQVEVQDVLVELSAPELQADVRRAEAVLAQVEDEDEILTVELEIARKRLAIAQRELKVCSEDLPKAKEALDARVEEYQQAEVLQEAGRISTQDLSRSRATLVEARAAWLSAGERVKNAQDEIEITRLDARRAELAITLNRSRVNEAKAVLEKARIRAGFAEVHNLLPGATVVDVLAEPGSMVVAGETPMLRLMALGRVVVSCEVPRHRLEQVKAGNPVRVRCDRHGAEAQVTRLAERTDPKTGSKRVEIELDNTEGHWHPGAPVIVVFHPRK